MALYSHGLIQHEQQILPANLRPGAAVVLVAEPGMIAQPAAGTARTAGTALATWTDKRVILLWHEYILSNHLHLAHSTGCTASAAPRLVYPTQHKRERTWYNIRSSDITFVFLLRSLHHVQPLWMENA
jgi:hypothetical protein